MTAVKAIVLVVVGAAGLAAGLFTFVPSARPGFVKAWVRKAQGHATDVKNNIKNNPAVKEQFEQELKSNLEKSN